MSGMDSTEHDPVAFVAEHGLTAGAWHVEYGHEHRGSWFWRWRNDSRPATHIRYVWRSDPVPLPPRYGFGCGRCDPICGHAAGLRDAATHRPTATS